MPRLGFALCVVLLAGIIGSASTAVAQAPPPCAPDATSAVTLTTQERSEDAKPIATHPVTVSADVDGQADDVTVAPPPGTTVLAGGEGDGGAYFIVPAAPTVAMTVTWRQPARARRPVLCGAGHHPSGARGPPQPHGPHPRPAVRRLRRRATRARAPGPLPARDLGRGGIEAAPPAAVGQAAHDGRAAASRGQGEIRQELPSLSFIKTPTLCRSYYLTCGTVTTRSRRSRSTTRRWVGASSAAIQRIRLTARPHPARSALGALRAALDSVPAKNKIYGLDLQIRQSGHLLGRVRRAGRCRSGAARPAPPTAAR